MMNLERVLFITVPILILLFYLEVKKKNTWKSYLVLGVPIIYTLLFETRLFDFWSERVRAIIFYSILVAYLLGTIFYIITDIRMFKKTIMEDYAEPPMDKETSQNEP